MYHIPSTWKRLLARLIDDAYVFILQAPVVFVFIKDFFITSEAKIHWAHALYFVVIKIVYETLCVHFFSATPGKMHMGLRLISRHHDGSSKGIGLDQALLRSLICQLSHIFGWSLYVTAFYKHNRTHVADWFADTQVVSSQKRTHRPKIRWILATSFIFFFMSGSIKGTAVSLNATAWKNPYFHFHNPEFAKMVKDMEMSFEDESDDDFDDE